MFSDFFSVPQNQGITFAPRGGEALRQQMTVFRNEGALLHNLNH